MIDAMRVDISWAGQKPCDTAREVAIIVDVLRGSSVVVAALAYGSNAILTALDVETAVRLAREHDALLAGETDSLKVRGFDFGNSPVEMCSADLSGRTIVLTSTNFPKAYRWARRAPARVIGSLLNVSSAVAFSYRVARGNDIKRIRIVLAGESGQSCDDDLAFVGAAAERFEELGVEFSQAMADAAQYVARKGVVPCVKDSAHARRLTELGLEEDVLFCCRLDEFDLAPIGKDDRILRFPGSPSDT